MVTYKEKIRLNRMMSACILRNEKQLGRELTSNRKDHNGPQELLLWSDSSAGDENVSDKRIKFGKPKMNKVSVLFCYPKY